MSNYPGQLDDDTTLPAVNDNLTEIGGDAINALRDAVVQIETTLGTNIAGSAPDLATRLGVSLDAAGNLLPSAITSLSLSPAGIAALNTIKFGDANILPAAGIAESKLALDYKTQDLFNYIRDLSKDINISLGWISSEGSKLEPHLLGAIYRHDLLQIDVAGSSILYLNNVFRVNRDNSTAYSLLSDMNTELLAHQWADGSLLSVNKTVVTNDGSTYPSNYAHTASGIYVNTSGFNVIPQTDTDVQSVMDFIDANSIFLLGTRIQNLYKNGISRNSRSSSLTTDNYGQPLVPLTPAVAYLRGTGTSTSPIDDFAAGDDIVQFFPISNSTFAFDEQFAGVRVGDIIRVNYAADGYNVVIPSVISEINYNPGSRFAVRIAGKNIAYSPHAIARIDRTLYNNNKYGVLASANVDTSGITSIVSGAVMPSLIIGSARGAQCLGVGFSPDQFNEDLATVGGTAGTGHFNLYLVLYPNGNPLDGQYLLPAIDVTGNKGTTPGSYTLQSIVDTVNQAFRQPGFNYRFIAFAYEGNFGIMLADSYRNASFSIISGVLDTSGIYNQSNTRSQYPNNVIDVFPPGSAQHAPDPLGLGPYAAGVASPPFFASYSSAAQAQTPTQIFAPLRRNNYYVNGAELEKMDLDVFQVKDLYGDGYWAATIYGMPTQIIGPPGHTVVKYRIPLDLSASNLKPGKTLVIQPLDGYSSGVDFGRFIIKDVEFSTCSCPTSNIQTVITVYDGVHGIGSSPTSTAGDGTPVAIYFNSDSVSFNIETAEDFSAPSPNVPFNRFFEVYIDSAAKTFTHERARFSTTITTSINGTTLYCYNPLFGGMNITSVSPKLRGYKYNTVNKINLNIVSYDAPSGEYVAQLSNYNGTSFLTPGPFTNGKIGEVTRLYDETNIDYIDIQFPVSSTFGSFTNYYVDLQLLPTLELDEEVMLVSTCQVSNSNQTVNNITDKREFGNISEEELSTSAHNYISAPERLLHFNGIIRGFDLGITAGEFIEINGGTVLVNGNIANINPQIVTVPKIQELLAAVTYNMIYALCVNSNEELVLLPLINTGLLGTSLPPILDRVMTVVNEVTGNTYQVDCDDFSNVLNNRKDLSPLYVIRSSVAGTGNSAAVTLTNVDIRRFVKDSDSSIAAVVSSDNSQGNFRDLDSALIWVRLNSAFQNRIEIKGSLTSTNLPYLYNVPGLHIIGAGTNASIRFAYNTFMTDVTFSDLTLYVSAILSLNVNPSANQTITGPVVFDNCTINVDVPQGFDFGSNVTFNNCTLNYNYNAASGSNTGGTYIVTDLVNAVNGMIYASVPALGILQNINITECTFVNKYLDHFPPISIQLTDNTSLLQNVNISGNTFIANSTVSIGIPPEDRRAAIAITSTYLALVSTYPKYPKVVNLTIEDNICNQDQMIILTGTPNVGTSVMDSVVPTAINCSISRNICGTIGYFVSANDVAGFNNTFNEIAIRDKVNGLTISDNTCHLIATLNNQGTNVPFYSIIEYVIIPTGQVDIINNNANWISVGGYSTLSTLGHGIKVLNNKLSPANSIYLSAYTNLIAQGAGNGGDILDAAISLLPDNNPIGISQSIISGNEITQNTLYNSAGIVIGPYYYTSSIFVGNNANVLNNLVDGVVSGTNIVLIRTLSANAKILVSGNILSRNGLNIASYISGDNTSTINIIGNTFDSATIDGAITTNQITNVTETGAILENINQNRNDLLANPVSFNSQVSGAGLYQDATATGNGKTTTIQAQATTQAGHIGGDLVLQSGTGPTAPGHIVSVIGGADASIMSDSNIYWYSSGNGGAAWSVNKWSGTSNGMIGQNTIYPVWAHVPPGSGSPVIIDPGSLPFLLASNTVSFFEFEWIKKQVSGVDITNTLTQKAAIIVNCDSTGAVTASTPVAGYTGSTPPWDAPTNIISVPAATVTSSPGVNAITFKAAQHATIDYYWQIIIKLQQA